jgi:hypothetical protein
VIGGVFTMGQDVIGYHSYLAEASYGSQFKKFYYDSRSFRLNRLKVGTGVEVRFDITLGYWLKITPALGYAHGFNQGGEDQVYFTIYAGL